MTPKPWLKSYPQNMPIEIDCDRYASLVDFFAQKAARFARQPAVANMGTTLSYAELDAKSRYFAGYLSHALGLKPGERIAIMLPNLLQYPIALLGSLKAGLIVVNTNPLYTARELEHQLQDSGACAIIILENFAHVLEEILPRVTLKAIITTRLGDLLSFPKGPLVNFVVKRVKKRVPKFNLPGAIPFRRALYEGRRHPFEPAPIDRHDIAFLQYTGGTTGIVKGAMLTHRNLLANAEQALQWVTAGQRSLAFGQEVVITALPLYHIFALTANFWTFIGLGGLNHLITNPRDLKGLVKTLKKIPFTVITGVNTLFNGLLNTPGFEKIDFSHLKITLGGGMPTQESVTKRWKAITGRSIIEAYGLTEASPAVCINPLDVEEFNGSIGLPLPSTECAIQDDAGHMLPLGAIGELCIRGPQVMQGYWKRPQETARTFFPGGWLRSGDIAKIDQDGFIYIVDRKKDMILVSGFNVYPNEIEALLCAHPGIRECGAIGISDSKTGEAVKVVIVKQDPSLDEEAVRQYCRKHLCAYKVPKHIEFRDELPKTAVGKVLRRSLRSH